MAKTTWKEVEEFMAENGARDPRSQIWRLLDHCRKMEAETPEAAPPPPAPPAPPTTTAKKKKPKKSAPNKENAAVEGADAA